MVCGYTALTSILERLTQGVKTRAISSYILRLKVLIPRKTNKTKPSTLLNGWGSTHA